MKKLIFISFIFLLLTAGLFSAENTVEALIPNIYISNLQLKQGSRDYKYFEAAIARSIRVSLLKTLTVTYNESILESVDLVKKGYNFIIKGEFDVNLQEMKVRLNVIYLPQNRNVVQATLTGYPDIRFFDLVDKISDNVTVAIKNFKPEVRQEVTVLRVDREGKVTTGLENLKGVTMRNFDFSGMNLSGRDMSGSDFTGSKFIKTNLTGANLSGSKFVKANMEDAKMNKVNATGADFTEALMEDVELNESNLTDAKFIKTNLDDASFKQAILTNTDFTDTNLYDVDIRKALFKNTKMVRSNLRMSDVNRYSDELKNADITDVVFNRDRLFLGLNLNFLLTKRNAGSLTLAENQNETSMVIAGELGIDALYFFNQYFGLGGMFNYQFIRSNIGLFSSGSSFSYAVNTKYLTFNILGAFRYKGLIVKLGVGLKYLYSIEERSISNVLDKDSILNKNLFNLFLSLGYKFRLSGTLELLLETGISITSDWINSDKKALIYYPSDKKYNQFTVFFTLGFVFGLK